MIFKTIFTWMYWCLSKGSLLFPLLLSDHQHLLKRFCTPLFICYMYILSLPPCPSQTLNYSLGNYVSYDCSRWQMCQLLRDFGGWRAWGHEQETVTSKSDLKWLLHNNASLTEASHLTPGTFCAIIFIQLIAPVLAYHGQKSRLTV